MRCAIGVEVGEVRHLLDRVAWGTCFDRLSTNGGWVAWHRDRAGCDRFAAGDGLVADIDHVCCAVSVGVGGASHLSDGVPWGTCFDRLSTNGGWVAWHRDRDKLGANG
jgi:hypothetical protein